MMLPNAPNRNGVLLTRISEPSWRMETKSLRRSMSSLCRHIGDNDPGTLVSRQRREVGDSPHNFASHPGRYLCETDLLNSQY